MIASVTQSLYSTIISFSSNKISCSFTILEISFTIHSATHHDLILNVLFFLCLYIIKYSCQAPVIYIFFSLLSHLIINKLISKLALTLGLSISFVLAKIKAQLLYTFANQLIIAFTIIIINHAHTQ
ncbi:MAG: hypothetical protein Q8S84_03495 [bacterium]|nr:hypothetical protein [bacterium]